MRLKLSISVLVSDRAETVKKCLNSLLPLLRAVPSELIIVYTGKEEESLRIARQYTGHIIPFTWCDDFSAARNAGLKEAAGEWFLYIDDDEWFEDCSEIIQFFLSGEHKHYESASYLQRNYYDRNGNDFSDVGVARMTRRTPQTEFLGIIHENLCPLPPPVKYFQAFVHHYNYVNRMENGTLTSSIRNIPLLLRAIEEKPENIKNYLQLAQEYYVDGQYKESGQLCRKILELLGDKRLNSRRGDWASAFLVRSLEAQGEDEEALCTGIQILEKHYFNQLGAMYLCLTLLPICNKLKKYKEGIKLADLFWKCTDNLDKNPKLRDEQQIMDITHRNIEKNYMVILVNELICAASIENYDKVKIYLSRFPWMTETMTSEAYIFLENWKESRSSNKQQLLECFASLSIDDPYIIFQKALLAELNQDEKKTKEYYSLCGKTDNLQIRHQILLMAIRKNYPLPEFVKYMDLDAWRVCMDTLAESVSYENYHEFAVAIQLLFYQHPIHKLVLEQKVLPRFLLEHKPETGEFNMILRRYCQAVVELNRALYRDELFDEAMSYCLPVECRAAMSINDALILLDQGDDSGGIKALRDIILAYPGLAALVDGIIANVEQTYLKPEPPKNSEFEILGQQIKLTLKQLMDSRQYRSALPIAEKLCELLPEDIEIVRWKQRILQELNN